MIESVTLLERNSRCSCRIKSRTFLNERIINLRRLLFFRSMEVYDAICELMMLMRPRSFQEVLVRVGHDLGMAQIGSLTRHHDV